MADEPTPRELLIQVQHLAATVTTLAAAVEALRSTLSTVYVPRGEYEEARKADDRRIGEVEKDQAAEAGFRRQVAAGFLVGALLIVVGIVLAVARVPGAGT